MITIFSGTRHEPVQIGQLTDQVLRAERRGSRIYVGDATGVDSYVRDIAHGPVVFETEWKRLGKRAGPARNRAMLEAALLSEDGRDGIRLVAFPAQDSRGTLDMIYQAIQAGVETHVYPTGVV